MNDEREVLRAMSNKLAALHFFLVAAMGGSPRDIVPGRNTVTDITIDILVLMDIAGGEWSELALRYRENKTHVVPQTR